MHSAVLLPAEEITDPERSPKWIPDDDDDGDEAFYEELAEPQPKKAKKNSAKRRKSKTKDSEGKTLYYSILSMITY